MKGDEYVYYDLYILFYYITSSVFVCSPLFDTKIFEDRGKNLNPFPDQNFLVNLDPDLGTGLRSSWNFNIL